MQQKVNYDGLIDLLCSLNEEISMAGETIRNDCGSLSYTLNNVGLRGFATSTIDQTFSSMRQYFNAGYDYITELINFVNTNVIGKYQITDENVKARFQDALNGVYAHEALGGYQSEQYASEPSTEEWKSAMSSYGRNN